ncbi:MAG: PepSY domain-containing protein [Bdellovibrionota bacterium]
MFLFVLSLLTVSTFAEENAFRKTALRMVKGEISREYHYYQVKTSQGTIVDMILDTQGVFRKAKGENPEKDELFVGEFGITLAEALKLAQKKNMKPSEWEFSQEGKDWYYTFREIRKNCDETEIKINASKGSIVE